MSRASRMRTADLVFLLLLGGAVLVHGIEQLRFGELPHAPLGDVAGNIHAASASLPGSTSHSLHTAIRVEAPGATVVVDAESDHRFGGVYARQLGLIERVVVADLSATSLGTVLPTRELDGPGWSMVLADGRASTLLAFEDASGVRLVDARIVTDPLRAVPTDGTPTAAVLDPDPEPSLLRAVLVDTGLLILWTLGGGLLLPRSAELGRLRVPLAMLTGVSIQASVGLLLLPWAPALVTFGLCGLAARLWFRRRGLDVGWTRTDRPDLTIASVVILLTTFHVRSEGLLVAVGDSFVYWAGARAMSRGELTLQLLDAKRGLALQSLHAPGIGLGAGSVMSLGPVLLLACVAILVLLPWQHRSGFSATGRVAAALLGALALSSSWLLFNSIYLNSHLLVAALVLGICVVGLVGESSTGGARWMMAPAAPMITALVLARSEAVLIIGVLLLGTLASEVMRRAWSPAWGGLGVSLLVWNTLLWLGERSAGSPTSSVVVGGALLGVVALLVPVVTSRVPALLVSQLPMPVAGGLWASVFVLAFTPAGGSVSFFEAARVNLGQGDGAWFLLAPTLVLLGTFGIVRTRAQASASQARWFAIAFVPTVMIAKLLDGSQRVEGGDVPSLLEVALRGGGRVGWGDSGNRMWTHAVFVVLLLTLLATRGRTDGREDVGPTHATHPRPGSPFIPAAVLLAGLVLVGSWWQPNYLGSPIRPTSVSLPSAAGVAPWADADGFVWEIPIGTRIDVPTDTQRMSACATVILDPPPHARDRSLLLTITASGASVTETVRLGLLEGRVERTICTELDVNERIPRDMRIKVVPRDGTGPLADEMDVIALIPSIEQAFLSIESASMDERSHMARGISQGIRAAITALPIALGLGLLSITLIDRAPRRRSSEQEAPNTESI